MGLLGVVARHEAHEQCGSPNFLRGAWAKLELCGAAISERLSILESELNKFKDFI
jgi:hypothetical protein